MSMDSDSRWVFAGSKPDGHSFVIGGIDVWQHEWTDTKEQIQVEDPLYRQRFTFHVFEMRSGDKIVEFAAGEFSNGIWGFYLKQ